MVLERMILRIEAARVMPPSPLVERNNLTKAKHMGFFSEHAHLQREGAQHTGRLARGGLQHIVVDLVRPWGLRAGGVGDQTLQLLGSRKVV
eukprot:7529122-Pyramimonas_sp.AAC.1